MVAHSMHPVWSSTLPHAPPAVAVTQAARSHRPGAPCSVVNQEGPARPADVAAHAERLCVYQGLPAAMDWLVRASGPYDACVRDTALQRLILNMGRDWQWRVMVRGLPAGAAAQWELLRAYRCALESLAEAVSATGSDRPGMQGFIERSRQLRSALGDPDGPSPPKQPRETASDGDPAGKAMRIGDLQSTLHQWMHWQQRAFGDVVHALQRQDTDALRPLWSAYALDDHARHSRELARRIRALLIIGDAVERDPGRRFAFPPACHYDGAVINALRNGMDADEVLARYPLDHPSLRTWVQANAGKLRAGVPLHQMDSFSWHELDAIDALQALQAVAGPPATNAPAQPVRQAQSRLQRWQQVFAAKQ